MEPGYYTLAVHTNRENSRFLQDLVSELVAETQRFQKMLELVHETSEKQRAASKQYFSQTLELNRARLEIS